MLTKLFVGSEHSCFERVILTWIGMLVYSTAPQIIVSAKLSKTCPARQSQKREAGFKASAAAGAPMLLNHGPRCLQTAPSTLAKQPDVTNGQTSTTNGLVIDATTASPTGFGTAQSSRCPSLNCTYFCPTQPTTWQFATSALRRMSFTLPL